MKVQNTNDRSQKTEIKKTQATSMAELLKTVKATVVSPQKGEIIKGKITKLTSAEVLVDINAKSEAVVLEKDKRILRNILTLLKVGDEVSVSVLNPESDFGNPVVSLRRYIDDLLWKKLSEKQKSQDPVVVVIREVIKGGFIVDADLGLSGFLPNSQASYAGEGQSESAASEFVGKKVDAYILELNRDARKIIFSQKPVLNAEDFNKAIKNLKTDQKIEVVVSNITSFGIFVSIKVVDDKTIDGLIHISEISWEKTADPSQTAAVGDKIEAVIIGFDREAKRVDLSIKRLTTDPFGEASKGFAVDQKISGKVLRMTSSGVVIELENGIEGLIRREKIPPTVTYKEGDAVTATVSQIDTKRRKIILVPVLLRKTIGYR